tara:strand:- start:7927 stop:8331 length:405 start_codon:yes stop_codon:yes gene_type:complete
MLPILGALLPVIGSVLDRLIPDEAGKAKAIAEMEMALIDASNKGLLAQIDVNKVEAAHRSIFVAGWRPFVGWCCGFALAWFFVVAPLLTFLGSWLGYPVPPMPVFDMDSLLTVLMGMLGLGAMRSVEKIKGVSK